MAKKETAPAKNTTPPTSADKGDKKKAGRKPGFSTKENDLFKANKPQPETKIAPQAKAIAGIVEASGTAGIKRGELIKAMEGVVETKQPQSRILSYYQKDLVENGFFTVTPAEPAPAEKPAKTEGDTPAK